LSGEMSKISNATHSDKANVCACNVQVEDPAKLSKHGLVRRALNKDQPVVHKDRAQAQPKLSRNLQRTVALIDRVHDGSLLRVLGHKVDILKRNGINEICR